MKKQRRSEKVPLETIALHEAAHAFYLIYGKIGLKDVTLKNCRPSVNQVFEHNYLPGIKVYLAGPAASMIHGIPLNHLCNSMDLRRARRLIKCFREDLGKEEIEAFIEKLTKQIKRQLKSKHLDKVSKIADALLRKKILTERQVKRIIKNV
jgi:hypothetical protein